MKLMRLYLWVVSAQFDKIGDSTFIGQEQNWEHRNFPQWTWTVTLKVDLYLWTLICDLHLNATVKNPASSILR